MKEVTLYAALDLSIGNKAATIVEDTVLVVERVFDFTKFQYYWFFSSIGPNGQGGPTIYDGSWYLGDELKKHGIDYMADKVWVPLESIYS